jgi:hypothetical protein
MLSPKFKVADFTIDDCNMSPIQIEWSFDNGTTTKKKVLFEKGCTYPTIKSLTFDNKKDPSLIQVAYDNTNNIVEGIPTILGRYQVKGTNPKEEKHSICYKVKLDINGMVKLDSVELIEEYTEEQKIAIKMVASTPAAAPAKDVKMEDAKEGEDVKMEDAKGEDKPETAPVAEAPQ